VYLRPHGLTEKGRERGRSRGAEGAIVSPTMTKNTFLTKIAPNFFIFFAQNPAWDAYSGHSEVSSSRQE